MLSLKGQHGAHSWLTLKCVTCAMMCLCHLPVRAVCMHSFQGPCSEAPTAVDLPLPGCCCEVQAFSGRGRISCTGHARQDLRLVFCVIAAVAHPMAVRGDRGLVLVDVERRVHLQGEGTGCRSG